MDNTDIFPFEPMTMHEAMQLSASSLAYLGDCVLEILVRERLTRLGTKTPSVASLKYVTAEAQCRALEVIAPLFTEEEADMFRRGRNSVHSGVPRHATPSQYRRATGLECLFGFLYMTGNAARARELFRAGFVCDADGE